MIFFAFIKIYLFYSKTCVIFFGAISDVILSKNVRNRMGYKIEPGRVCCTSCRHVGPYPELGLETNLLSGSSLIDITKSPMDMNIIKLVITLCP